MSAPRVHATCGLLADIKLLTSFIYYNYNEPSIYYVADYDWWQAN